MKLKVVFEKKKSVKKVEELNLRIQENKIKEEEKDLR